MTNAKIGMVKKAGRAASKSIGRSEDGEQIELFRWVRICTTYGVKVADDPRTYSEKGFAAIHCGHPVPELDLLFSITNGGERDIRVASLLKATGVKAGVSDMFLPVPRHGRAGLWIELKREDGGTESDKQKDWGKAMLANGFGYVMCHGWKEVREILIQYLSLDVDS